MNKKIEYCKYDARILKFKYGTPEHKFYNYIMLKEYCSSINGISTGKVELTVRTLARDIGVTDMVSRRLINLFINEGIIELDFRPPKGSKKASIYILKVCI